MDVLQRNWMRGDVHCALAYWGIGRVIISKLAMTSVTQIWNNGNIDSWSTEIASDPSAEGLSAFVAHHGKVRHLLPELIVHAVSLAVREEDRLFPFENAKIAESAIFSTSSCTVPKARFFTTGRSAW
jgi:hypothetical protein